MTEPYLVSVILPTFNRAHFLERAIESVLRQTHSDLELIVVDDGSTDSTREVVTQFCSRDSRVRYVFQDNQGVSIARNHGLRLVSGKYIALLDSDDAWKPWKLEVQLACLKHLPQAGMIWTDMEAIDPEGNVFDPKYLRKMYSAYKWFRPEDLFVENHSLNEFSSSIPEIFADAKVYVGDIFSQMIMGNLVHTPTVMVRRERADQVGGFDESLRTAGGDFDFHLRTCKEGPVAFIDVSSIYYQCGMADRRTHPSRSVYIARNYLSTISKQLTKNRERIQLPHHMISYALWKAHAWIGEAELDLDNNSSARRHLAVSLRYRFERRSLLLFALSLLPITAARALRSFYAKIKRLINEKMSK